jgi:2-oxoglutarate dehydrogenase E2 component (dihydrolipoamide succinyltransferase)
MAVSVTMRRLGESVSEGTVTRWLKNEGDRVEADEPLLEVSTDKVDTEIPAPAGGIVSSIKVQEDETVEVGVELATIDDGSGGDGADGDGGGAPAESAAEPQAATEPAAEAQPEATAEPEPQPEPEPQAAATPEPAPAPAAEAPAPAARPAAPAAQASAPTGPAPAGGEGAYVTPLVRKLATEHGVDLANLSGTGVGGRIRKQDVLDAAEQGEGTGAAPAASAPAASAPAAGAPAAAPAPASSPQLPQPGSPKPTSAPAPAYVDQAAQAAPATRVRGRTEQMTRLRKVIATRLTESLQTSAQLTSVVEADVTRIARLRGAAKDDFAAREGTKLSFLPFFALATIEALKLHPVLNASIDQEAGTITYHEAEHLGIAVDSPRGLLVPVIHEAGDLNLAGMARKIADLAERTRSNSVTPDELGGGTFTLTNTGSRGALFDTPIINQPQVGILGTGAVVKRPVVVQDAELGEVVAVRSMIYFALTYDHRIVDGADAARFLGTVKTRLEEGDFAAELGL